MPFNMLVTTCYKPGSSHHEQGKGRNSGISVKLNDPESEKIIFFVIDEQTNPRSKFREYFDMESEGENISDLLVYYSNIEKGINSIVVTELKSGSDFKQATKQLINTINKIKDKVEANECLCDKYCGKLSLRACCVSKGAKGDSPNHEIKNSVARIKKETKIDTKNCAFIDPDAFYNFLNPNAPKTKNRHKN